MLEPIMCGRWWFFLTNLSSKDMFLFKKTTTKKLFIVDGMK